MYLQMQIKIKSDLFSRNVESDVLNNLNEFFNKNK